MQNCNSTSLDVKLAYYVDGVREVTKISCGYISMHWGEGAAIKCVCVSVCERERVCGRATATSIIGMLLQQ